LKTTTLNSSALPSERAYPISKGGVFMMEAKEPISRRDLIKVGLVTGASGALGFALAACTSASPAANAQTSPMPSAASNASDITHLNAAINLENQAIWAYTTAAGTGKLDGTDAISKAVKTLALRNAYDHQQHAAALAALVTGMGGTPTAANSSYDLSAYISAGEGNLNDLPGIARLALALEVDAALAYEGNLAALQQNSNIVTSSTILPDESAHATAIRCLLQQAGLNIGPNIIPASFLRQDTRSQWVIKM
jgi:rubrerythrin